MRLGNSAPVLGGNLLELQNIPKAQVQTLFLTLILSSVGIYIGGSLGLGFDLLISTLPIAIICWSLISLLYLLVLWGRSLAWALILIYTSLLLLVWQRNELSILIFKFLIFISLILGALSLAKRGQIDWIKLIVAAITTVATIMACENIYTTFDMIERAHAGTVHKDTLFHVSISAMIKNYGVVSTGLSGLVETPYHVLSHYLFAAISLLSGQPVLEVYGVLPSVLFAPLIPLSIVWVVLKLHKINNSPLDYWVATCLLLAFVPLLFTGWAVRDSFWVSESYLVSLGIFLCGMPYLFKEYLTVSDRILVIFIAVLAAIAKAPVGLAYIFLWGLRVVVMPKPKSWILDFGMLLLGMAVVVLAVLPTIEHADQASGLSIWLFDFIGRYTWLGQMVIHESVHDVLSSGSLWLIFVGILAVGSFIVIHFILSWIVMAQLHAKLRQLAFKSPMFLYVGATILAGLFVAVFLKIPGGSAYYITNISLFFALPSCAAVLGYSIGKLSTARFKSFSSIMLLALVFIDIRVFLNKGLIDSHEAEIPPNPLVTRLEAIRDNQSLDHIWHSPKGSNEGNPIRLCTAQPFLFPAISERPWVGLLRTDASCEYKYYGYSKYNVVAESAAPQESSELIISPFPAR